MLARSRRAALKAGVAAGIGLAAWTGPTITSIGGTPAYAATCTNFTVNTTSADRNTNQGNCSGNGINYVKDPFNLPAGYLLDLSTFDQNGHCSNTAFTTSLTFPAKFTCTVNFRVYRRATSLRVLTTRTSRSGPAGLPLSVTLPTTALMETFNPGLPLKRELLAGRSACSA